MAKDRAAPFSRKHRRYWLPVTGGMILIGIINVGLGLWLYETRPRKPPYRPPVDAGVPTAPPGGDPGAAVPATDAAVQATDAGVAPTPR